MSSKTKDIIIVSKQAGTANAFVPIINSLQMKKNDIVVLSYEQSSDIFSRNNINYETIHSFKDAESILNKFTNASFLLTGTSADFEDDSKFWLWAKQHRIKSGAFVDQWIAYEKRFSLFSKPIFPSYILLIDNYSKEKYLSLNVEANKLIVFGHPAFDCYKKVETAAAPRNNILFVSEPFRLGHPDESWDETVALQTLIDVIESGNTSYDITIRPHPLENNNKFDHFLNKKYEHVSLSLSLNTKFYDLTNSSLIIGISSILIFEGLISGLPSASLLPSLNHANDFINVINNPVLLIDKVDIKQFLKDRTLSVIPGEYDLSATNRYVNFLTSGQL